MEGYLILGCFLLKKVGIEEAVGLIVAVSEVNVACFEEDCVGRRGIAVWRWSTLDDLQ